MDLKTFFTSKYQKPLLYNCVFTNIKGPNELFDLLKKLFYMGISIQNKYNYKINKAKIDKLNPYFNSLGFKINYIEIDTMDMNIHYENLLNEIPRNTQCNIIVGRNFKNDLIESVTISNTCDLVQKLLHKYFLLNFFEKWYLPVHLHDYYIISSINVTKSQIIYFDYFNDFTYLDEFKF